MVMEDMDGDLLMTFQDAISGNTVASEWLNKRTGMLERVDCNGSQDCDEDLYEALL